MKKLSKSKGRVWEDFWKKTVSSYEKKHGTEVYDKPANGLKTKDRFAKLTIGFPDYIELDGNNFRIGNVHIMTGKNLTLVYAKSDVTLLADI